MSNTKHPMTSDGGSGQRDAGERILGWGTFEAERFGTLWLSWSGGGLRSLSFHPPPYAEVDQREVPQSFTTPLRRYFEGDAEDFLTVPLDLRGTEFQMRVWQALRGIPWGQVRTYGGIAVDVGSPRAMRAVGQANHVNPIPIVVPCHRVVEAGHQLGGYGGGIARKCFLLELEGVRLHEGVVQPGQLELF